MASVLLGYGELGRQIEQFLIEIKNEQTILYFDDNAFSKKIKNAYPFNSYKDSQYKSLDFYVCLGYLHLSKKKSIIGELKALNLNLPSIIHPTCYVSKTAEIGNNVYLYPLSNIDKNVQIKDGTLINNSVIISHDTIVNECCYISPGAVVSGFVNIGEASFLGSGCDISNNIFIGKNSRIGIGTVVTKDLPENSHCVGNPMKLVTSLDLI